jgi:hypothetical protein
VLGTSIPRDHVVLGIGNHNGFGCGRQQFGLELDKFFSADSQAIEKPGSDAHDYDKQNFFYRVPEAQSKAEERGKEKKINRQGRQDTRKNGSAKPADPEREEYGRYEEQERRFTTDGAEDNSR